MREMLRKISAFYKEEEDTISWRDAIFVSSVDDSVGGNRTGGRAFALALDVSMLPSNTFELLKSRVKGRAPVYRRVSSVPVSFHCPAFLNLNNGTAVVLQDQRVDKFYFKDLPFFGALYRSLARGMCEQELLTRENFLCLRQPRYQPVRSGTRDVDLLVLAQPALNRCHMCRKYVSEQKYIFSIPRRVEQLFVFYHNGQSEYCAEYLEVARRLDGLAAQFEIVLCHGDLWKGNLLQGHDPEIALVDFDKAVLAPAAYDYVYFHLMSRVLFARVHLEDLLRDIERHTSDITEFLSGECGGVLGSVTRSEIRIGVLLFVFLKGLERDLRHLEFGRSLNMLIEALARLE